MEENQAEINFFQAHSLFINEIRSVFHTICLRQFGENWQQNYSATFRNEGSRETWNGKIRDVKQPQYLIECSNLAMFSDHYQKKKFFRNQFGRISSRVSTYFKDIAEARNMVAHHANYDSDIADRAYLHMITISNTLGNENLVNNLRDLRNGPNIVEKLNAKSKSRDKSKSNNNDERLYTNTEIQIKISEKAQALSEDELNKLCDRDYSKAIFNNTNPIFVKVPQNASKEERQSAIKDHKNKNRWTVKYEFNKNNYSYFITTQWYPRNDVYVKNWLQRTST